MPRFASLQDDTVLGDPLADRTNVHPLGLAAVLALGVAALLVPRRFALIPLAILACFIPSGQRVVIIGLDFTFLRLMVFIGWLRILLRSEFRLERHALDWILVAWAAAGTVCSTILWGTTGAFIQKLGDCYDALGMYFLVRCLLRDWRDLEVLVAAFSTMSVVVLLFFVIEKTSGRNVFSVFGGVPEFTQIREGKLRCQGAFSHPILAGCFWVTLLPLMAARWWGGPAGRLQAVAGTIGSLGIVALTASSTPVLGVGLTLVGGIMFVARRSMKLIRWSALATLVALHVVMKAPVWHLLARMDVISGSTGWHRYYLIDQAIKRIDEWWLVGTRYTGHWGLQLFDVTNQYVLEGIRGGLLTLILFVLLLAFTFRNVGRTWRRSRSARQTTLSWALGVALFTQMLSFLAVSYFGQIILIWYLVLAASASLDVWTSKRHAHAAGRRMQARVRASRLSTRMPTGHTGVPEGGSGSPEPALKYIAPWSRRALLHRTFSDTLRNRGPDPDARPSPR